MRPTIPRRRSLERRSSNYSNTKVFETQATPSELAIKSLEHPKEVFPASSGNLLITDRNTQRSIIHSLGQVQVSPLSEPRYPDCREPVRTRLSAITKRGRLRRDEEIIVDCAEGWCTVVSGRPSPRGSLGEESFEP